MVESELDPEAVTPVCALGVVQLIPGTAAEMAAKYPDGDGTIPTPHVNIRLGVSYYRLECLLDRLAAKRSSK